MNKIEMQIKGLIQNYIDNGDIKELDAAEKLFDENVNSISMSWEQIAETTSANIE